MWSIFSGRRRVLAASVGIALVVAAVILALALAALPPAAAPTSAPTAAPTASPTGSAAGSAGTPGPVASASPAPSQTLVQVPADPLPAPASGSPKQTTPAPVPAPVPPAEPFPAALAGRDLELIPGAGPLVALTFDAGANSAGLASILQTLAATGVRGTFFLTGSWASANPAGVAAIVAGGHRVGNHSMTHPGFTGLTDDAIADEVLRAQQAIESAGGDPRPLFRFPFGARDARTIATVNRLGYLPVRWTVDTLGWKGTSGGITAQAVADRVLGQLQPGEIVLMHIGSNPDDGSTLDADALIHVISRIRQAGYGFTALDALLK